MINKEYLNTFCRVYNFEQENPIDKTQDEFKWYMWEVERVAYLEAARLPDRRTAEKFFRTYINAKIEVFADTAFGGDAAPYYDKYFSYRITSKEQLLRFCKYYDGSEEKELPEDATHEQITAHCLFRVERMWVEQYLNNDKEWFAFLVEEYQRAGLRTFEHTDDTPATLKALLYCLWTKHNEFTDTEGFKEFYHKNYTER